MSGTAGGGALRLRVRGLASPRPSRAPSVGGGSLEGGARARTPLNRCLGVAAGAGGVRASEGGAGTSCARRLCQPRPGPPALPAAILFSCCFLFAAGPSLSPSRASLLLARRPAVDRRRRVPVGCGGTLSRSCPSARGSGGTGGSGVGTVPGSRGTAAPAGRPASGHRPRAPAASSARWRTFRFVGDTCPPLKSPWTEPAGTRRRKRFPPSSPSPGASCLVGAAKVAIQLGFG